MNKQTTLLLLVLFTWLTWNINVSNAINLDNLNLKDNNRIEIKWEKINDFKKNKRYKNNEKIENPNLINTILDEQIQKTVLKKLQNKIKLTKFKKDIKKNLQKRRKIHKILIEKFNNNLTNTNYLQAISKSWIKITNIIKIRDFFFSKSSA